ncbi:hypothetical protein CPLU01_12302 [Colletotrichum plurivorum]|uniref:Uncharacterized protein n=1 Tax=Colletotrichum plurivorum TaxID=2175906 RepID=A0A8H6JZ56_9PEZI|nr:hypothetical protein CPLU01_12302 [Colletotrichum plurivorum]
MDWHATTLGIIGLQEESRSHSRVVAEEQAKQIRKTRSASRAVFPLEAVDVDGGSNSAPHGLPFRPRMMGSWFFCGSSSMALCMDGGGG